MSKTHHDEGVRPVSADQSPSDPDPSLRQRAEDQLQKEEAAVDDLSTAETAKLIYELRTHQIELEIQNEELRRAQAELLESRDRYSDLYDFAPVGYLTLDEKGVVLEANLTLAELLGVERQELLTHSAFHRYVSPDTQNIFYKHRMQALESSSTQTCALRLKRSDGTWFDAQLKSAPVVRPNREATTLRTAVTDISQRRQAELQRETLIAELEAKNTELEWFSYTVSHDLKSPLITIQGYLGVLRQDITEGAIDAVESDMDRINGAAEKMNQLLNGLLELSRVGRISSAPTDVPLTELAHECAALVAGPITQRNVLIEVCRCCPS